MVSPSLSDGLIDNHFGVTCSYLFLVTLFSTLSPTIINVHPSQHLNITTTMITTTKQTIQFTPQALSIAIALGFLLFFFFKRINKKPSRNPSKPALPVVPGLPLVGNLLQLKDKKPNQTFTKWAETYGPIYSIKTGATTLVVINTADVAREAMVTRFSSISTRKLSNATKILSLDKTMVALSDYGEFHKMAKRNIITGLLGGNAQKRYRGHRVTMMNNIIHKLHTYSKEYPLEAINLRVVFQTELFGLALKQAVGKDLESPLYVEELGTALSKNELYNALVVEPMMGAIDVDWRDFFPYLRWIPNKRLETRINHMAKCRKASMKALIGMQKNRIESGEGLDSFLDFLLASEGKNYTEDVLFMLVWESIIEMTDTILVTTEWAMYELAKNKSCQDYLFREIESVCGSNKISEDHLSQLPYLSAIFHETLRRYSPVALIPLRYVHEDTELGGYHIPAGSEISINIYGCNMNRKQWEEPEKWKPERFLDSKFDPTDMFKTMAFGAGKKVCSGSQQAMTLSCLAIGSFVQEFEWRLSEGQKEEFNTLGLTSYKLHALMAFITPREG